MTAHLHAVELIAILFVAVIALSALARRLLVPYPILLVIGGLMLGFVPGLPPVQLDPDVVFFVFLPPILWAAAYFTSLREFRQNLRPITLLAVGLVAATTAVVAVVARTIMPGLSWAGALALGAIVSPPDAVAAVAILHRLRIPRRVIVVLEGESLVNDASALVLYRMALVAMVSGQFSAADAATRFAGASLGGIAIGIVVGAVAVMALRFSKESVTDVAITLLAPYVAWSLGERTGVSAVLSCVVGGFVLRRFFSSVVGPGTRLQARAVWDLLLFGLNGLIFVLIGLQLRPLAASMATGNVAQVVWWGLVVSAAVIVTRFVWVPISAWLQRRVPSVAAADPMPPWSSLLIVAWAAMRGVVSLAAALALPATTAGGAPLPYREELILITFVVILVTLVAQGLTLAPIARRLRVPDDDSLEREEMYARERALKAGLACLDRVAGELVRTDDRIAQLRREYEDRLRKVGERRAGVAPSSSLADAAFKRVRHAILTSERRELIRLRDEGEIGDEVLLELDYELDLEAARHGLAELRDSLLDEDEEESLTKYGE